MRKANGIAGALVLSIGFIAGCGNGGNNERPAEGSATASGSASGQKVELTWWVDAREDLQSAYASIKSDYETAHPGTTIKLVKTPDDKIAERISIAINTAELPDVQQGAIGWPLTYAKKGLLVPLEEAIDKEDFETGVLDSLSVDGHLYIIPNSITAPGMMVNLDLFEAKGATDLLPKNMATWTYDQFKEAAKAVNDPAAGIYGFGTYAGDTGGDQSHHLFLWGFGASTWSDDKTKAVLNSPEGVEGLDYLTSLIDEGLTPPGVPGLKAGAVINEMFLQGKIGMTFGSLANFGAFDKAFAEGSAKKFNYDIVPYPSKDGKSSNSLLLGYGTWVWNTKDEAKMSAAKDFATFANSKESMAKMAEAASVIATRKSMASSYAEDSPQGKTIKLSAYAKDIGLSIPGYAETRNAFFPELQAAFTKHKTAQQALDDWVAKANEIIASNAK
ncbi:ABC transporter substrate-binding protein [Cohnella sp. GbtcB17]|uniref:ABC transporter substrate-binding protein n=1 Tax=Cohnella sp. GbtcB17 TaxID=2824762 RepID=UPI001C2F601B|nr:sugar ABC transporter substrate-binding protein [Cohnella sp. GbtcB17]